MSELEIASPINRWARLGLALALAALTGLALYGWAATAPVGLHANPAVALTRGPYLQSVVSDSVIVVWETDVAGSSQVDYGLTSGYGSVVSDSILLTHHALTLTGLSPYTAYHYRVSTNGQLLGSDNVFRSAAVPTQTTFSFVAFGDTRTDAINHQKVVNSILSLSPDFVLHMGDMVENGSVSSQWTTFFNIERDLIRQAPLYGVLGNHEQNSPLYFEAFHLPGNERWYSFDYGNVHFIGLEIDGYASYAPGSEQMLWLANDSAQTRQTWKVVFFHIPPYSSGSHGSDLQVRAALEPLFIQYGVDLVFNGHDHDYERSSANEIVYIVTGGGGAPLSTQVNSNPASVYFTSTYHSVLVTVTGSLLAGTAVRSDGVAFDRFSLFKADFVKARVYLPMVFKQGLAAESRIGPGVRLHYLCRPCRQ
jgi:predicted phosphodiesterase